MIKKQTFSVVSLELKLDHSLVKFLLNSFWETINLWSVPKVAHDTYKMNVMHTDCFDWNLKGSEKSYENLDKSLIESLLYVYGEYTI